MAKFNTNISQTTQKKNYEAFVDTGATHHFFHQRSAFITYSTIVPESVESASATTQLIGKGNVLLPIGTGIIQEAYHASDFTSNVIAGHLLSESFELLFSNTVKNVAGCFIYKKGSLETKDIIMEIPVNEGLYPTNLSPSVSLATSQHSSLTTRKVDSHYKKWHEKLGHISSERFQQMSTIFDDIPLFARFITNKLICDPCVTSKM